jgi:hypothetical protein
MVKQLVVFDTDSERLEGVAPEKAEGIAIPAFSISATRPPTGTLVGEAYYVPGSKQASIWTQTGWMDMTPDSLRIFPDLATMQLDTSSVNGTPGVIASSGELFVKVAGGWRSSVLRRYPDLTVANADALAVDGSLGWLIDQQVMVYRENNQWQRLVDTPRMNLGDTKPPNPISGDMNFSPTSRRLEIWNGTKWEDALYYGATVGEIKHSILTEAQFATAIGTIESPKWLLCDGRSCAGTSFASIAGLNTVPDLRGAFLRGAGQNANASWTGPALNAYQEDSTKRPNTAFTGTTNNTGAHTHNSDGPSQYTPYGGNARVAWEGYRQDRTTSAAGAHTHTLTIDGGGDAETRPKSYGVNYFLRVSA